MAGTFNPTFNPADVMLGGGPGPYMNTKAPDPKARPNVPVNRGSTIAPQNKNVLGAQSVRASGAGPFDPAYRQDLSTYAGGNFVRPGGNLSFNPTGSMFGQPTGGGNAPVPGMPTDLLTQALGGAPFATPQKPAPAAKPKPVNPYQNWWQNWQGGNVFGRGRGLGY
jgi:hypothetical protein